MGLWKLEIGLKINLEAHLGLLSKVFLQFSHRRGYFSVPFLDMGAKNFPHAKFANLTLRIREFDGIAYVVSQLTWLGLDGPCGCTILGRVCVYVALLGEQCCGRGLLGEKCPRQLARLLGNEVLMGDCRFSVAGRAACAHRQGNSLAMRSS